MSENVIKRQLELVEHHRNSKGRIVTEFTGIIYSHWSDGRITRRESADGEDVRVGYTPCDKVDHDKYEQHTAFMRFISQHAYNMSYPKAYAEGLLPKRPETLSEKKARRLAWYEREKDRREKWQKENGFA